MQNPLFLPGKQWHLNVQEWRYPPALCMAGVAQDGDIHPRFTFGIFERHSVARLCYLFTHLHLLSSDSSSSMIFIILLFSSRLFSSLLFSFWLFPPVLFHPSLLSEVWLQNFLRLIASFSDTFIMITNGMILQLWLFNAWSYFPDDDIFWMMLIKA